MALANPRASVQRTPRAHSLNEAACPAPEQITQQVLRADPKDAAEIARQLPEMNRARLAAFCYGRKHLNHLGLMIASTLEMPHLRRAFGTAAAVVYQQSRDVDATIAEGRQKGDKAITLADMTNVVRIGR